MKNTLLLILIALLPQLTLAQRGQGTERIRALKTAHITESLELSPEEAAVFWPVYNQYRDKLEAVRRSERSALMELKKNGFDNLTTTEANQLIDQLIDFRARETDIQRQQVEGLKKVLDPVKILKLQKAEEDFKRMLLNRYRGGRGG